MSDGARLDKKITSFVVGLAASFGITYARKFVANRYGEDSAIYRFLEEHYMRLARDVHDHLTIDQPQMQQIGYEPKGPLSDYEAGVALYNQERWREAFDLFCKADKAEVANAANYIGLIYKDARIKWADLTRAEELTLAAHFFERAISLGDKVYAPLNLNNVGFAFDTGEGVPVDQAKAFYCYAKAFGGGSLTAAYNLALSYEKGEGVEVSLELARDIYAWMATQGGSDAANDCAAKGRAGLARLDRKENAQRNRKTRAEALETLELQEGATKQEMRASYMRLMQQVHPDKGGSNYFAKQLNEAREVLEF